jgi:predicted helicase
MRVWTLPLDLSSSAEPTTLAGVPGGYARGPMGSFTDAIESLSPDPAVRGRQFEYLCEWLLSNDPLFTHELARVWRWDDWPGRWGGDAGIDLVAQDRQGDLWAIQAKAYNEKHSVKKSDIDTFLSESARPGFTFRLLIATTGQDCRERAPYARCAGSSGRRPASVGS